MENMINNLSNNLLGITKELDITLQRMGFIRTYHQHWGWQNIMLNKDNRIVDVLICTTSIADFLAILWNNCNVDFYNQWKDIFHKKLPTSEEIIEFIGENFSSIENSNFEFIETSIDYDLMLIKNRGVYQVHSREHKNYLFSISIDDYESFKDYVKNYLGSSTAFCSEEFENNIYKKYHL